MPTINFICIFFAATDDFLRFFGGPGQRFFHQHISFRLHRCDRHFFVKFCRRTDIDAVQILFDDQHFFKTVVIPANFEFIRHILRFCTVGIAHSDNFHIIETAQDRKMDSLGNAAQSDDANTSFFHRSVFVYVMVSFVPNSLPKIFPLFPQYLRHPVLKAGIIPPANPAL